MSALVKQVQPPTGKRTSLFFLVLEGRNFLRSNRVLHGSIDLLATQGHQNLDSVVTPELGVF
eukprot:3711528-Ditylum_brightwellii.AAC.1